LGPLSGSRAVELLELLQGGLHLELLPGGLLHGQLLQCRLLQNGLLQSELLEGGLLEGGLLEGVLLVSVLLVSILLKRIGPQDILRGEVWLRGILLNSALLHELGRLHGDSWRRSAQALRLNRSCAEQQC